MKTDKKLLAIGAALVLSVVFSVIVAWKNTGSLFTLSTIRIGVVTLFNVLIIGYFGYKFFGHYSSKSVSQFKKRVFLLLFFFFIIVFVFCSFMYRVGDYFYFLLNGWDTTALFRVNPEIILAGIKQYSVWVLAATIFFFYMIWRQAVDREQKLREENLKYQYRTLKTQVNPHFLFNSLNTLSEIVYADAKKADNYIQKLSGIYRYILDNEETDLIPLNKEIEFVRQYFDLQKERDDDKIQLEIDVENADKFKIIPVSLQALIENSLKHNAMSEENPLKIHIYHEGGYVVVSNIIQRKNTLDHSSGMGLLNLKERAKLITGKEIIVNQENNLFLVKLPVICM